MAAVPAHRTRPSPPPAQDCEMVSTTRVAIDLLAPKWRVEIVYLLARGTRRYGQLYAELGTVSKKVLTQALRALEQDGLVERIVYAEVPVRVEYELTPLGWSLTEPLEALSDWGQRHRRDVERARDDSAVQAA